jgi:hypothetical protein
MHTFRVSTSNQNRPIFCPYCNFTFGHGDDYYGSAVDHLISAHGYRREYVGQEMISGPDGQPTPVTVATLSASVEPEKFESRKRP